jgi:hypothetical protein
MVNEVIRTSGDLRRNLSNVLVSVIKGEIDVSRSMAVAALAKEITANLQMECNAAKVNLALTAAGKSMGQLQHMGKMLIGDDSAPTLDGTTS